MSHSSCSLPFSLSIVNDFGMLTIWSCFVMDNFYNKEKGEKETCIKLHNMPLALFLFMTLHNLIIRCLCLGSPKSQNETLKIHWKTFKKRSINDDHRYSLVPVIVESLAVTRTRKRRWKKKNSLLQACENEDREKLMLWIVYFWNKTFGMLMPRFVPLRFVQFVSSISLLMPIRYALKSCCFIRQPQ